jgi:hypothetical protein
MLFEMCLRFCKRETQHKISFHHGGMMLCQDALVLVQERKLAHARFP